jgi:membrane-bound lytic murein transglycosylase B
VVAVAVVAVAAAACGGSGVSVSTATTSVGSSAATSATAGAATTAPAVGVLAGLPDDADGLAAVIVAAERAVRDPGTDEAAAAAAGRRQQLAYSRLGSHPEWIESVRAQVPADVRSAFEHNLAARLAPPDVPPGPPGDTLPDWRIRAPRPAADLLGYYHEAAARTGIPWQYLAAINLVETRMGRIAGTSSAGAVGPMQFLPTTWAACCTGDPTDDHDAILGAATYLVRRGGPADMAKAILGYNPNRRYLALVTNYATVLAEDERAYRGYHAWEVFVDTSAGLVRLPVGYASDVPVDAAAYLAEHPEDRAGPQSP